MLLVFFPLLSIPQSLSLPGWVLRHGSLSYHIGAIWLPTFRSSLVVIFRVFLLWGRRNERRSNFGDLFSNDLVGYCTKTQFLPKFCFLHACNSALDLMQGLWRVGYLAVSIFPSTFNPKRWSFIFQPDFDSWVPATFWEMGCLPVADNHLSVFVG